MRVGRLLADVHQIIDVREVFGVQSRDADNVAYARSKNAILVTGDGALAKKLKGSRQCGCLHLRDLKTHERDRVLDLRDVIEHELTVQGELFWMQIGIDSYYVGR